MSGHSAESDARCDGCGKRPCVCETVVLPSAENGLPVLTNACAECDNCFHPVIGPNTDGEPCEWCQDCGCHADQHTRMTRIIPPGRVEP